jgi:hypothetical protein
VCGAESNKSTKQKEPTMPSTPPPGQDTATGTDPDAKYTQPGYEDVSLGQAVDRDQELADRLLEEHDGDVEAAETEFEEKSAGAPARKSQET